MQRLGLDQIRALSTRRVAAIYPKHAEGGPAFRMFEYPAPPSRHPAAQHAGPPHVDAEIPDEFPGEPLSLGRWVAISGAAFSTGLALQIASAFFSAASSIAARQVL